MLITKFCLLESPQCINKLFFKSTQSKEKCIRQLVIPDCQSRSDQKSQSIQDDGSKRTLLRLADKEVPSSLGFTMIKYISTESYPQLQFDQQENDFQQQSNNKKKGKNFAIFIKFSLERNKHHSLKYLSYKVHSMVGAQQETTYKQMADKLVSEISNSNQSQENQNLKRRVYDSINVMVALGVLEKRKKIITKGSMFQQNHMTSKYVRETLDRYLQQKQQQMAILKEKKKLFSKLTNQLKRIMSLVTLNKELTQNGDGYLQSQQTQKFQFPIMMFKLPSNAKLKIVSDDGKTIIQILSDHEIKIQGELDILSLIPRIEDEIDNKIIPIQILKS